MAITQEKLAVVLGISQPAVSKYCRRGMPLTSKADAIEWLKANKGKKIDSKPIPKDADVETDDFASDTPPSRSSASSDLAIYNKARAAREVLRAKNEKMELAKRRGKLYDTRTMDSIVFLLYRNIRDALLNIDERIGASLGLTTEETRFVTEMYAKEHRRVLEQMTKIDIYEAFDLFDSESEEEDDSK